MAPLILFLAGAALTIVPLLGVIPGLSQPPRMLLVVFGAVLMQLAMIAMVITRLYRKASANAAFVRTGMGGAKVVQDGGTLVMPVVHQVIPVSLQTTRLNVEPREAQALTTKDGRGVNLSAEFYVNVQPNSEDILKAAQSLGGWGASPHAGYEMVREKLVSALRRVAATRDMSELHGERGEFSSAVQKLVTQELARHGLVLESMNIFWLAQAVSGPARAEERGDRLVVSG